MQTYSSLYIQRVRELIAEHYDRFAQNILLGNFSEIEYKAESGKLKGLTLALQCFEDAEEDIQKREEFSQIRKNKT